ncbi:unnamed protein product [Pylaiella littoralis]
MQEVNVTELWLIVESLQSELVLLRGNLTSSTSGVSTNADQLDTMGKEMNSLWLMLGTMFILRKGERFADEVGDYGTAEGYNWALWLFQWSFSGTSVTIVSGAVGARITMSGYVLFAQVMVGFIYPVVARWGWNAIGWASPWSDTRDDLLFGCGVIDFAGSGVVHTTGGMAALVMVILIGPHANRFSGEYVSNKVEHGAIMETLGAFLLWVGWYGFNGCSTMYLTGQSHVAAKAMVCTTMSAAAAVLGVTSLSLVLFQHVGTTEVINGLLSGLVAISAGCSVVEADAAFFIGLVAALNYLALSRLIEMVLIDDMVDASPVHLANGVWGVVAAGLFATEEGYSASYYAERKQQCCGLLYGCGGAQLMANLTFILAILAWAGAMSFLAGYFLKFMGMLRISNLSERVGTECDAQTGAEVSKFAENLLTRLKCILVKAGEDGTVEATSITSGGNSPSMSRKTDGMFLSSP